jgi:hypothetical protein
LSGRPLLILWLLVSSTAALSASTSVVKAAEECRLEPGMPAPTGSKWVRRINRDHRQCWFLSPNDGRRAQPHSVASIKHRHDVDNAAVLQKHRSGDPHTASAPRSKLGDTPATKPPTESQAGISSEQFSKDLNPRSVPTIAYRVQGASAPIGLMPVAPYAVSTQRASEGGASVPNVIVFAGAALGCLGAGSILWFAGRNLTSARGSVDLDPHNLEERPADCLSAAIFPSPVMDDWAADLRRKLDEHGRHWPGAHKAAEGDFASAPRSSPMKQTSRQLMHA